MGWPQLTVICLFAVVIGVHAAKHGEPQRTNYNFWTGSLSVLMYVWLLYMGGFFDA